MICTHIQVPRDYAAFEKLQKDVLEAFPDIQLPSLPRKFHVFFDDSDVEERQVAFDCLVKVIAKHKEISCSSPLLNFLGFKLLGDREYYKVGPHLHDHVKVICGSVSATGKKRVSTENGRGRN